MHIHRPELPFMKCVEASGYADNEIQRWLGKLLDRNRDELCAWFAEVADSTNALLKESDVWRAVEALAAQVLERGSLAEEEIAAAIKHFFCRPEPSA